MPLPQVAIDELKVIYKKKYGTDLSDDEAWEMGNRLIRFFSVIYRDRPLPTPKATPTPPPPPPLTPPDSKPGNVSSSSSYDIRYVNG